MGESNWDGLEGIEATERILSAAINSGAREVHLSSDGEGGTVFFVSPERIEFFRHIPIRCRDALRCYLRDITAIDQWREAPASGFGVFSRGDETYSLEVQVIKGSYDEDLIIKIGEH